ncbi:hypothetical protein [Actinoplanes sp. NPDC051851]|uniref:hypothetical protein n=1 Tax=Actinoplanes sp. NPDC051851 TaxID=3154753 RepID=UPI00341C9F92
MLIEVPDTPVASFAYRDLADSGIGDVTLTLPVALFSSQANANTPPLQEIGEALMPILEAQYPGSALRLMGITLTGVAQTVPLTNTSTEASA